MQLVGPLLLSLAVAACALFAGLTIALPLGAWMAARRGWSARVMRTLATLPLVMPPTVSGYALLVILGRRSPLGHAYETLTGHTLVFSQVALLVAATVGSFPFLLRAVEAALRDVPPPLVEAARVLGVSRTRRFFTLELPLAKRGIGAGMALAFARALGDFGITLMLGGNIAGETRTGALALYDAVEAHQNAYASSLAGALAVTAAALLFASEHLTRNRPT